MGARAGTGTKAAPIADAKQASLPVKPAAARSAAAPDARSTAQRHVGNQTVLRSRGVLQRKCACGTSSAGTCEECGKASVQRRADGPATSIPASVGQVLQSPGHSLDPGARNFMESRFGRSFSDVRLHTNSEAAQSARDVHAKAYTVGNHIVFGAGQYEPHGGAGRHLLAHELAHTVQQNGLQARADGPMDITSSGMALERQADAAADQVMRGGRVPALVGPIAPVIARTEDDLVASPPPVQTWSPLTLPAADPRARAGIYEQAELGEMMAFRVHTFVLPGTKGPLAGPVYTAAAGQNALRAVLSIQGDNVRRPELTQSRAATGELRDNWVRKVGWQGQTPAQIQQRWIALGGSPARPGNSGLDPVVGSTVCQMDHILELQLGGTNVDSNVQVLDPTENQQSGSGISQYITQIAQAAYNGTAAMPTRPTRVILQFDSVQVQAPVCSACCQIESRVTTGAAAGTTASGNQYPIRAGGASATIVAAATARTNLQDPATPANQTASEIVPGLRLQELERRTSGADSITSAWDAARLTGRARATRVPIDVTTHSAPRFAVEAGTGLLRMTQRTAPLSFVYPYLSRGELDLSFDPGRGFSGTGRLTPSLPLLRSVPLQLELTPDQLRLFLAVPPERLRTPIPNFRFTRAELSAQILPEFHPEGILAFEIGPRNRPIASGEVRITADAGGLVIEGTLDAHIPRVDNAQGRISYRNGEWSGGLVIESTQIGIPHLESGRIAVGFTNAGITVDGRAVVSIPGGHTVTFNVRRAANGSIEFIGEGEFHVPGLHPVTAEVRYDGTRFRARARTGIDIGPLSGDVTLVYEANPDEGTNRLSGEGTIAIRRGRVDGTFTGRVNNGLLTGEGSVRVRLTDNLIGTVGIVLDDHRRLRVSGELVVPRPIEVFPRVPRDGGHREFFNRSLDIPILGIPLGPLGAVGLIARITLGFGANYNFGPGTLENIRFRIAFNPLEDDLALVADGHAEFNIPAYAGVYLRIRGGLGLSVAIASVTGGIEATLELGLRGAARTAVDIHYERDYFSIEGMTRLSLRPVLQLDLVANVIAEVGALGLTAQWRKDWRLAHFELPSRYEFGLEAGIGYNTRDGVRLPSFDRIRWIYPEDISARGILNDLLTAANR